MLIFILLFFLQSQLIASNSIRQNRCELKLVADYIFYRDIGNRNYANAARYLINLIERVNGIFSPIEWGLDINGDRLSNLGFVIKEMKIFEKPEDSSSISHFNSPIQSDVNAVDILDSFSAEEGTNSTCLTILITAKSLQSGVVGLANIGDPDRRGVCAVKKLNNSHYMNTGNIIFFTVMYLFSLFTHAPRIFTNQ
uniref:Uncharacterized protein n=1 Tax=Meloidogyne incognita TaxID=6306 RepID=A0A914KZN6_MELIC